MEINSDHLFYLLILLHMIYDVIDYETFYHFKFKSFVI